MSQVSLSTAEEQPLDDLPSYAESVSTPDLAELAEETLTNQEGEITRSLAGEPDETLPAANAPAEHEATLMDRTLQQGKYRLLAVRAPATDAASQVGVSYVALHTDLQRRLTLRELPLDQQASAEQRDKTTALFLREVRALARLSHPSLPRVHDYFCEGDACYVVMDELAGRTLADVLAEARQEGRSPALPPLEIARLGLELARALAYLHQQRPPLVLGGLRAEDIALPEDGPAQLVSLGALSLVASSASHPSLFSIPRPLADQMTQPLPGEVPAEPERAAEAALPAGDATRQVAVTPGDDVLSLGLLLCELAGGPEVIAHVMERQRHPEQVGEDDVPPLSLALAAVIEMAAQPDTERRFQSAAALENALARAYAVEQRVARLAGQDGLPTDRLESVTRLENGQPDLAATSLESTLEGQPDLATRHFTSFWGSEAELATICWKCGGRNVTGSLFCRVCGARQPVLAGPRTHTIYASSQQADHRLVTTGWPDEQTGWEAWLDEEEDLITRPMRATRVSGQTTRQGRVSVPRRPVRRAPHVDDGHRLLWALVWVCYGMALLLGSATGVMTYLALH